MLNLRALRKNKGLTMKQLGEKIDVAESTISLYERGKREPDNATLIRLANYFGVSVDYLLGRDSAQIKKAVPAGRPEQSVALSNYEENCENLATDEHFVNTAHLYAQLNILMRSALYGSLVRWLEDHGVNVSQILGLN